jgi:hypothetical protein
MSGVANRARALLPHSFHWDKVDESHGIVSASCLCGEILGGGPLIMETGSCVEIRCKRCGRYIQLRASYATDSIESPDAALKRKG